MPSAMTRKGSWDAEEDVRLENCIKKYGEGKWYLVPHRAGLDRCRKSCRLRWLNYLKPNIKRGDFESDEVDLMIRLHKLLGNRWSLIAGRLPGRTANDVKNYWNTHRKKLASRSRLPLPNPPSEHPQPISTPYLVQEKLDRSPSAKTTQSTETANKIVSKSLPETPVADDGINAHFEGEALLSFDQDSLTNFWDNHEIIFPETKEGNTFEEEMKNGWSDIWDILNE